MNYLLIKYEEQAQRYKAEFEALDELMPSLDFEQSKRHAETEVLYNKCLEIAQDLREASNAN